MAWQPWPKWSYVFHAWTKWSWWPFMAENSPMPCKFSGSCRFKSRGQFQITHVLLTGSRRRWSTSFDHATGLAGRQGSGISRRWTALLPDFQAESGAADSRGMWLTEEVAGHYFWPRAASCGRHESNGVDWWLVLLTEYSRARAAPRLPERRSVSSSDGSYCWTCLTHPRAALNVAASFGSLWTDWLNAYFLQQIT